MKITITQKIGFDSGHRIIGHETKCKYLHGHRYTAEFTFEAEELDPLGRIIDFGIIKEILNNWINTYWDHNVILANGDEKLANSIKLATNQKPYMLPFNPTAENMAVYLLNDVCPKLFSSYEVRCIKVRLYETPNCYSEATF
ncbi:6-pyruvoyl trahydropterin synthase family protein [Rickettsiales endosymbiont of Stachyamoeba lipophora]|uniref:6-pyruvoyl trahydropterin synthase family protein n=1 Tax=Rickettsiales endosymbiont of Stachyamoeba lipophora TaxID=2486578 RepID=UPI000F6510C0|nr:6-carboxytetrahydropterin synthase [Rickettsiales endosymbiont of Stachyamoeba lipophora]AZL15092.1 6-carboxytetrahydropterin synthase [Rickettsiales endosymbiont of Stachyamoeba lipophora]